MFTIVYAVTRIAWDVHPTLATGWQSANRYPVGQEGQCWLYCLRCGQREVHGHYRRQVEELRRNGWRVTLEIEVRRFRCNNAICPRRSFAERLPGLTLRYPRCSGYAACCGLLDERSVAFRERV